jgi:hypothetical protein
MCFYAWSEEYFITGESQKFQNFWQMKEAQCKKDILNMDGTPN